MRLYLERLTTPEIASRTYHSKSRWTATSRASNGYVSWRPSSPKRSWPCCARWPRAWWPSTSPSWTSTASAGPSTDAYGCAVAEHLDVAASFVVAHNPGPASKLGHVISHPLPEGPRCRSRQSRGGA